MANGRARLRGLAVTGLALALVAGCGSTAASGGASTPTYTAPETPTGLAAAARSSTEVVVGWGSVTSATSYGVQRADDAGGQPGTWGPSVSSTGTTFGDTGLSAGTTYWYRVSASNAAGTSPFTSPVSVRTPAAGGGGGSTAPAAPASVSAIAQSQTSVLVLWDASAGASGYVVQRAPDASGSPGAWAQVASPASPPWTDSGLSAGTTYWYRVSATNGYGSSAFAPAARVTTTASGGGGGTVTTIPAALSALSTKRIYFLHASVGGNVLRDMQTILDASTGAKPTIADYTSPSAIRAGVIADAWFPSNGDPNDKVAQFRAHMNTDGVGAAVDIAFMKLCFADFDAGGVSVKTNAEAQALFENYRSMVNAVQAAHPGVKLVHFTSALTLAGNGRREAYNNLIRSTYGATGRVFDLADIESNGHTDSEGRVLDPAYETADNHLNSTGGTVVANRLLLFLANLP